jgi:hypothetical protein
MIAPTYEEIGKTMSLNDRESCKPEDPEKVSSRVNNFVNKIFSRINQKR